MKYLPRGNHHLVLWFSSLNSLLTFRTEYLEIIKNVHTSFEKHTVEEENGYKLTIDLVNKEKSSNFTE
jgi:hypothetical protein